MLTTDIFDEEAETCHMPRQFVFLKKHKCASSTFQTIFSNFNRHLGKKSLTPLFGSYGGGYPARMNMSFWAPPIVKGFCFSEEFLTKKIRQKS